MKGDGFAKIELENLRVVHFDDEYLHVKLEDNRI